MRFITLLSALAAVTAVVGLPTDANTKKEVAVYAREDGERAQRAQGFDIGYSPDVDWTAVARRGTAFAYILATEGSGKSQPHLLGSAVH